MNFRCMKLLMLAVLFLSFSACGNRSVKEPAYGEKLLLQQYISRADLERLKEFNRNPVNPKTGKPKNSVGLFADTEDWIATQPIPVESEKGPYRMVIFAKGKASTSGEALMHWNAMWNFDDGIGRGSPGVLVSKNDAVAGEVVTLLFKSEPIRFKKAGEVFPVAEFIRTQNFDLQEVEMQVWYGIEKNTWLDYFFSLQALFLGVVFLGVTLWFRGR